MECAYTLVIPKELFQHMRCFDTDIIGARQRLVTNRARELSNSHEPCHNDTGNIFKYFDFIYFL